ncbi:MULTISPECIES: polysaccharide biosynthesis/export family protein [unclassified Halomonas]|uniref:polysaccharide biosynthesis/export family protein n=1 Tax=unclassified Halomonas TaxID=2609666 RepID=UPI0028860E6E|nr:MULTISPECIES: polysaccharide biosynthesis/export family protein [unclassified Halomonas]MDT0500422.1 polysaccharide biosynthesis/export family protein [Halomonas sp. PAR7]MDT0511681.1 polysaccharide biosynthesis/export family protein [Halomonas sp. LES1]MDT0590031.1 polysaccharide biosynthesis/export family protein [Halomonas sp. PAR8]
MPFTINSRALLAGLLLLSLPLAASAQSISLPSEIVPDAQQRSATSESLDVTPRADWRGEGTYGPQLGPASQQQLDANSASLPPFGANLFEGGFRGTMADGLNPGYTIKPGDQVTLRAWGAVELDQVAMVDAQGNIFIPSIGPLRVQGQNSSQLDASVRSAIESVYPENVQVYTNLQGVQPVGVFVTGYVENPGRYAGTPSDSLLYFLDQAGGIDNDLGSYRDIRVMRSNRTVARVDLYDFLLDGTLARPQFRDGDTIVVEERGPAVAVLGDVKREYRYELTGNQLSGAEVTRLARLQSGVSHVLLRGSRTDGPFAHYYSLAEFADQSVYSGDEVTFSNDARSETIVVELEGSYFGPSRYALPRNARLGELLDAIAVPKQMTAVHSISLKRESVRRQQAQSLEESLRRLEMTYLGTPSRTSEEASSRAQEAKLIQDFVKRARRVEPSGRLVVAHNDRISDIRLQDGDVVTIPESSDSILVSGEIVVPQAVVFKPGLSAMDYIEGAGGFSSRADDDHILLVRQNGAVVDADGTRLRPGDEILVMPKVPTRNLELATSITQILYQIAVATKVAVDL